jgi:hypothetical protein
MPLRELITVYSENNMKPTNTSVGKVSGFNIKAGDIYSNHFGLRS